MPGYKPKGATIRLTVDHVLSVPELANVVCSFEQIITPLNSLTDVAGQEGITPVTEAMIAALFKERSNNDRQSYTDDLQIFIEGCELFYLQFNDQSVFRYVHQHDNVSPIIEGDVDRHPLNKPSFKKTLQHEIPNEVKTSLETD